MGFFVLVCFVTNVEVKGDSFTSNFEIVTFYEKNILISVFQLDNFGLKLNFLLNFCVSG